MTNEPESTSTETRCDCEKCQCPTCRDLPKDGCACCAHGCTCCGHGEAPECGCEDDCGCTEDRCHCGHGPCDSHPGCCGCGCGGCGTHACPVCGMKTPEGAHCACTRPRRRCGHVKPCSCPVSGLPAPAKTALAAAVLADLALKAAAIHRALKLGQKKWVVPLAVLNTAGVLPGYYLISRREETPKPPSAAQ